MKPMHTVPYIQTADTPLPGGIWRDLVKVRDALRAGVSDPAELRRLVSACSTVEHLVDLGQRLCMFDEPEAEHLELESGMLRAGNVEAFRISLSDLRALLARAGLYIVSEDGGYKCMWEVECERTLRALEHQKTAERALESTRAKAGQSGGELEADLPCPGCGRPMARVGGPGARRGWTCVNCNAAGDSEDDLLDAPPSFEEPESCSCDEALALRDRLDRCRAIVRVWGLAEVTPEAARVALERELAQR